jgi:type II secretory pathway component PulJ
MSGRCSPASAATTATTSRQRRRAAAGFSLLEVLIAGALLAIGVAATLAAFDGVRGVVVRNRHMTQALHAAESVAESMLALDASHEALSAGAHSGTPRRFDAVGQEVAASDTTRGIYAVDWNVQPNVPVDGIRRITLTVRWNALVGDGDTQLDIPRR